MEVIQELGWPHPSLVQQMSLGFEELPKMLVVFGATSATGPSARHMNIHLRPSLRGLNYRRKPDDAQLIFHKRSANVVRL